MIDLKMAEKGQNLISYHVVDGKKIEVVHVKHIDDEYAIFQDGTLREQFKLNTTAERTECAIFTTPECEGKPYKVYDIDAKESLMKLLRDLAAVSDTIPMEAATYTATIKPWK
jgi:hypothetical protein